MKKLLLLLCVELTAINVVFSQGVAINASGVNADNSAMLDIASSTGGLLIPRMTTSERNSIVSPAQSLQVFNTDVNCLQIYLNSQWQNIYCDLGCTGAPTLPGAISGNTSPCINSTAISYSVIQTAGATSYSWSVPSGAVISAGQGTTGIIVTFGTLSGNISVTASNNCGTSAAQTLAINLVQNPDDAGSITGADTVCLSQTGVAYSVSAITGAASYVWNYSGTGFTIASGNGTNNITADFSSGATSGDLTVYGTNGCGSGSVSPNFAVTVNSVPSSPTEGAHVPGQTQTEWKWNAVSGATGYKWSTVDVYSGATDMGGNLSNTETGLNCNTAYTRYVWAYNACGNSSSTMLTQTTGSCCSEGTGGAISYSGGYTIHTFTTSGTFTPGCAGNIQVVVVAGGGGGSRGGGGAGGMIYEATHAVTVQAYTVTVGTGGAKGTTQPDIDGQNGTNSVFDNLTAIGGGGGGHWAAAGHSGGSGGGAGAGCCLPSGGTGTSGQGYNGGNNSSYSDIVPYPSGGGGGAGAAGGTPVSTTQAGAGGVGLANPVAGSTAGQLVSGTYYLAGGGGGGINNYSNAGAGGWGGGGAGCSPEPCWATAGTANTGGGGGGSDGSGNGGGGDGGSGIVIISYPTP